MRPESDPASLDPTPHLSCLGMISPESRFAHPDQVRVQAFRDHTLAFVARLGGSMDHSVGDFHDELASRNAKARPPRGDRASLRPTRRRQPRVRERIMKLSKVYSATCHHRYWSER